MQTQWLTARGATRWVFRSDSELVLQEAVEQGQGIGMFAEAAVRGVTTLLRLDAHAELPSPPVFLVFHRELRHVPRVRLVIDALALRDGIR